MRKFNGHRAAGSVFNNVVYNYGNGYWSWPTQVWSRSNTMVGVHVRRAARRAESADLPRLEAIPVPARTESSPLKGVQVEDGSTQHGIAIPSSVKTDFFGKKINPKKPPRGAAG